MGIIRSRADASTLGDAELVERVRSGDTDAYGVLWQRHARAGSTVARSYTSSFDPDDLVSESYAKIFQAIRAGGGPNGAFRPYLFTTIRNTAAAWGRARRETTIEDAETIEDPAFSEENSLNALDRSLTVSAFRTLPTRWQEALWYSEVEGMSPQEIAPLLGMKANAVAALTYRAREGLRQAWIQAHLQSVAADSECRWTIDRLGGYARKSLGKRDTARVDAHLHECAKCTIVAEEAKDVGSRLALVLLPLAAGVAGATGYAAWMQTGAHTATYALGAGGVIMPAAAVGGAATQSSGATAGGTSGAAGGGTAGAGAGAGASIGGIVVGASVVGALVIGGVVTAIALGPTLFGGTKAPSQSNAQAAPSTAPAPSSSSAPDVAAPTSSPSPASVPSAPSGQTEPAASVAAPADTSGDPSRPNAPTADPAPSAPAVSTWSVGDDGTLNASGTGTPGNTVAASMDAPTDGRGFARSFVVPSVMASTVIGSDGRWSLSIDLTVIPANGNYTVSLIQSSPSGLSSRPIVKTLSVDIDATPIVLSPRDGASLAESIDQVSGTIAHADAVTVQIDDAEPRPATLAGTEWTLPVTGLTNGAHRVSVVATFRHRTATTESSFRLVAPPAITTPPTDDTVTTPDLPVSGTGIPGNTINARVLDATGTPVAHSPAATTSVQPDGSWRTVLDLSAVPDAEYTLSVTQTAADGTVSTAATRRFSFALAFDAPVITAPANGTTLTTTLTRITGTVGLADTVHVRIDGGGPLPATLSANGSWSVDAPDLANGEHTIVATAGYRDRVADSITDRFMVAVPPAAPVITAPGDAPVTDTRVVVAGTGTPGDTVSVRVRDQASRYSASATVGGDGWSTELDLSGLPNGDYTLVATQTDAFGITGASSESALALRVQLAAPVITVDTDGGRYFPIVAGTSAPGATIVVSNGSAAAVSVTADSSGKWHTSQLTGFAAGANAVTAYRSDGFVESPRATAGFDLKSPTTTVTDVRSTGSSLTFSIGVEGLSEATVNLLADHQPWSTVFLAAGSYLQEWQWTGLAPGSVHTLGSRYASADGTRFGPENGTSITVPRAAHSAAVTGAAPPSVR